MQARGLPDGKSEGGGVVSKISHTPSKPASSAGGGSLVPSPRASVHINTDPGDPDELDQLIRWEWDATAGLQQELRRI